MGPIAGARPSAPASTSPVSPAEERGASGSRRCSGWPCSVERSAETARGEAPGSRRGAERARHRQSWGIGIVGHFKDPPPPEGPLERRPGQRVGAAGRAAALDPTGASRTGGDGSPGAPHVQLTHSIAKARVRSRTCGLQRAMTSLREDSRPAVSRRSLYTPEGSALPLSLRPSQRDVWRPAVRKPVSEHRAHAAGCASTPPRTPRGEHGRSAEQPAVVSGRL
jgi:hypothetical protein